MATMLTLEPSSTSYRERLRAGGRGAFQRALDAGIVPKSMKQEWNGLQASSAPAQGFLPKPQPEGQGTNAMQYSTLGDSQQMWNGTGQMQSNDGWCSPMNQPQMQSQQPFVAQQMMSQSMQVPQQMPQQMMLQVPMPQDQVQQHAQMMPTAQSGESNQMAQMMAIVMPQAGQFPCDRELMAAQLQAAAADCQCYED